MSSACPKSRHRLAEGVPPFRGPRLPLVGGRVDLVDGRPAATLVYRHRQHLISLTALPADQAPAGRDERARDGFSVLRWSADGMAYWAVSDLGRPDLDAFAKLFRARAAAG